MFDFFGCFGQHKNGTSSPDKDGKGKPTSGAGKGGGKGH